MPDQDSESFQAQNIGEIEIPDAQDTSNMQIQDGSQIPSLMVKNAIPIYPMTRHLKHHRKIIIILPSTMMNRMTQYNLTIQSPNHSCQEASEYPLQR